MQDERSLVERARANDYEALTQIYEDNFDRIYRYVFLKIGERTEAEDIAQQVFINAIKSISSFNYQGAPVSAWLYRIAHNQVVDYLRKKNKRIKVPLTESLTDRGDGPVELAERVLDIHEVHQAMSKLTKSQQEVISLRFTGELSIAEIAKQMGKSEGAIKALQHSAIISLRKIMSAGV